ncbi:MAG TPA: hypothetical protein VGM03_03955, partial [Phycisphaerae bacterium]
DSADAFREAAARYQAIIDSGIQNGRLYYNLANAQLQLNDLGHALANYRRAEKLIPGDGRLKANLDNARALRRNRFETPALGAVSRSLLFWHYGITLGWRFAALLAISVAFWTLLILRTLIRRWRWRYALSTLAILALTLGVSVAASLFYENRQPAGVIVADNVTVRKGNGEGYEPRFEQPLHAGVEFDVLERRADWLHVRLPDSRDGWIRVADAEII